LENQVASAIVNKLIDEVEFETGIFMNRFFFNSVVIIGILFNGGIFSHTNAWAQVKAIEGFEVTKIYDVSKNQQGSWVSITTDPAGRLITSDQYGALYRVTCTDGKTDKVEKIDVPTGRAQGILYAFDSLYIMSHANKTEPAGLYRIRDTNSDDQYDSVEMLRPFPGRTGEHGPHAIILSPDKKSIYICAGNHTTLPEIASSRVPKTGRRIKSFLGCGTRVVMR